MTQNFSENISVSSEANVPPIRFEEPPHFDEQIAIDGEIPEQDNTPEFTYGEGVSVLDVILGSDSIGKPVEDVWYWKRLNINVPIRSVTQPENNAITNRATKRQKVGRSNNIHTELDTEVFNVELIKTAMLDPDLNDARVRAQLAAKLNCNNDVRSIVNKMFLPGEAASLGVEIMELSGFTDEEEIVKALKDSSSDE